MHKLTLIKLFIFSNYVLIIKTEKPHWKKIFIWWLQKRLESRAGKLFLIKREDFAKWASAKGLQSISVFINHLKDEIEIVLIKFQMRSSRKSQLQICPRRIRI